MIQKQNIVIFIVSEEFTKTDVDDLSKTFNSLIMKGEKNFVLDLTKCDEIAPLLFNDLNIIANRAKKNLANFVILSSEKNPINRLIQEKKLNSSIPFFYSMDEIRAYILKRVSGGLKYFTMEMAFSGELDNLPRIREFIWSVLHNLPITEDEGNLIVLAIDEAVANIMKYAYKGSGEKHLIIQAQFKAPTLRFLLVDNGEEFDPTEKNIDNVDEYIKEGHHGGLGIYIIEQVMDKFNHFYVPGMGNRLIMEKVLKNNENFDN